MHGHAQPCAGERRSDGGTDAARSTGDNGNSAFVQAHDFPPVFVPPSRRQAQFALWRENLCGTQLP
jgi:hypothetical protein